MARLTCVLFFLSSLSLFAQEEAVVAETFSDLDYLFTEETDSIYVINFWATWCGPCVAELPYFNEAAEQLKEEKVRFIFISLDFKKQYESRLLSFLKKNELNGEVFNLWDMDYNAWIDKVSPGWSGAIPFTLIRSSSSKIGREASFESADELTALINSIRS